MSQPVRIMPCLDMQEGRVVKGVHFVDIRDAGDPVACARAYCAAGADELAMLDITATVEGRATLLDVVRRVADAVTVPFTVGGGISDVSTAEAVLAAGADKVSISSAAFRKPELVPELIRAFGADKVTVAIDVDQRDAAVRVRGLYRRRPYRDWHGRRGVGQARGRLRCAGHPAHQQGGRRRVHRI